MKRIYFSQQKPFGYVPLRAGLGLIAEEDIPEMFCPKIYTTRTRRLSGEYIVVEGSRFRAKPVEPEIKFNVSISEEIDLKRGIFKKDDNIIGWAIANRGDLTFPELDLGIKNATFQQLRNELLCLNKKATIETQFYVSLLERII